MDNTLEIQYKLLGSYMVNSDLFVHVHNLIRVTKNLSIFTTPALTKSYEIIKDYHSKNIQPDIILIYKSLHKLGFPKKEADTVSKLDIHSHLSPEQVKEYVEQLFADYVGKYLAPKMQQFILNKDSSDPLEEMIKVKDAITNVELALNNVSKERSSKEHFDDALTRIKAIKSGEIIRPGFSWGVPSLDEKTIGIVRGINAVAGDKGCGKTSLLINIIRYNALEQQIPLLFFSLEMSAIEVMTNIIANVKRINSKSLRTGNVDEDDILSMSEIKNRLNENFVIDETGGINWQYFEAKARAHRKRFKIPYNETILVLLDYLQLMKNSSDESKMSREERLEHTSNELMRVCKNENIALVELVQFSREGNKRGDNPYIKTQEERLAALRPRMGDLKGSSAIESNAVAILLLFRPDYYGITEKKGKNGEIIDLNGLCEVNGVKLRYASPEPLYLKFSGKYNLFEDYIPNNNGIITTGEDQF